MNGVRASLLALLLGAALLVVMVCDAQGGEELSAERHNPRLKSQRSADSSSSSGSRSTEESGKHGAKQSPTPTASDSPSEVSKAPAPETSPKP
uniref:Putative conserved secreted protein n=1 Tax=Ixodes ricinus TaxID=34613 RepID=A0A6B0U2A7_IXORI